MRVSDMSEVEHKTQDIELSSEQLYSPRNSLF